MSRKPVPFRPSIRLPLLMLLVALAPSAAARAQSGGGVGRGLFEAVFTPAAWAATKPAFAGDVEKWSAEEHRGESFLNNNGGAGAELVRPIDVPAGQPVGVVVDYGWKFGRGAASMEIVLAGADPAAGRLVLVAAQGAGDEKFRLFRESADGERSPVGAVGSETVEPSAAAGGGSVGGNVALLYDPASGGATIRHAGADHAGFQTQLSFVPNRLILRDTSSANEQLRLASVRAYAGAVDPVVTFDGVRMPFGASFVQGSAAEASVAFGWNGGGSRDVTLAVTLVDESGDRPAAGQTRTIARSLASGEAWPIDLAAAFGDLRPGLYRLKGTANIFYVVGPDDRHVAAKPIDARFAVLSKELADRPASELPEFLGMVPYLNPFPREQWPEAFAYMERIGVRHLRWLPGWGRLEPAEGEYDWSETDEFMRLADAHGMTAMFCLSYYGAEWANKKTAGQLARSPEGRAMWVERFAVPVMKRYGDRVKVYQIWNEPDAFWDEDPSKARGFASAFATPQNYYDLLTRTWEAKQSIDPDLRVMASLASGRHKVEMERLFGYGLGDQFDGIVLHTYGNHLKHLQNARKFLADKGHPDAAILVGETGLPTPANAKAERRQANKVASVMLGSATIPNLFGVDWFVLTDRVAEGTYGLLDSDLRPQPSAVAYFTIAHLLAGATGGAAEERGALATFRVDRAGRPPLLAMTSTDGSRRQVTIRATGDGGAAPVVWDLMGRKSDIEMAGGAAAIAVGEDYVFVEGDVAVEQSVQVAVGPAWVVDARHPAGGPQIAVMVDSDLKRDVPAEVALGVAQVGGARRELPGRRYTLKPGENRIMFDLPDAAAGALYDAEAEVRWRPPGAADDAGGRVASIARRLEFTPAAKVAPEQADALRRPDGAAFVALGPDDFTELRGGQYTGADDNSAEVAYGWTDTDLVVWVAQTDDVHMPVNDQNPWGFDGPQLAIDEAHERSPGSEFIEVNFGLAEKGPIAFVTDSPHFTADLLAERDEAAKRTYYRLKVPLAQMQLEPTPGRVVGVAMIFNDNDGKGREGWLGYGGGIGEEKNPARYREVILAAPAGQP